MKSKKRIASFLLALVLLVLSVPMDALAVPYDSYNYDYWNDVVKTPAPYVPDGSISAVTLGLDKPLANPQDICVAPNGSLYIADTGNNRIIIVSGTTHQVERIITSFDNNGAEDHFSAPTGVCVSKKEQLYIADRENKRIVVLDDADNLVRVVQDPKSDVLGEGFVFKPLKISVDYADRIYCIAQNMFQGIMVFETDGNFSGFFGTIDVTLSLWEKFWKKVATKEERSNQTLYIATEFTGIDIDEDGFVYATNIDKSGEQGVRRLNPKGEDVIKKGRKANVGGDLWIDSVVSYSGPSQITDVVYRGHGIYSLLDRKRGRIFTYDHEGNLLYIFGGLGTQKGTFNTPTAIEQWENGLLILDANRAEIYKFAPTEYGSLINEAVALRHDGDESQAVPLWARVLELDENNELANAGIGKAYLSAGDNATAMKYLKIGMNRDYYSIAFKRYRSELLRQYLGPVLTGTVVLICGIWLFGKLRQRRNFRRKGGEQA